MESRDVVACPGSGKTTALLAKLLILSARMPFDDGRGLCVLTHTNVAIDQIKRKAGVAAEALFRHPNFFGTIQEFTNRFLAIPAYVARFGQRHIRMYEDVYEDRAWRAFRDAGLQNNGAIYGQLKGQLYIDHLVTPDSLYKITHPPEDDSETEDGVEVTEANAPDSPGSSPGSPGSSLENKPE